jgi:hypothetical protein
MFSCGFTYDEIMKLLKQKKAVEWEEGLRWDKGLIDKGTWFGLARTVENEKKDGYRHLYYVIIKPSFDYSDYEYCKLAHEVLHICQFLLPDILNRDREYECEAYLHTHLMQQCLSVLRGKK